MVQNAGQWEEERSRFWKKQMRMFRRIAGVTLRDMIRSEQIREQGGVADIVEKLRGTAKMV